MVRVSTRKNKGGASRSILDPDPVVEPGPSSPEGEFTKVRPTKPRGRKPKAAASMAGQAKRGKELDSSLDETEASSELECEATDAQSDPDPDSDHEDGTAVGTTRNSRPKSRAFTPDQKAVIAEMIREARSQERGQMKRRQSFRRNEGNERFSPSTSRRSRPFPESQNRGVQLTDSTSDDEPSADYNDSSGDSSPERKSSKKSKKWDKRKRAPLPTLYWIGQGKEPTKAGRVAGSREKFSDRRHKAKERLETLSRICKGQMSTMRHAQSHLLLGFQLRETRRLLRETEDLISVERHSRTKNCREAMWETDEKFGHLGAALQLGIDACRHEIAIAGIHSIHGESVVQGVEGEEPKDPRYESRTDYVIKKLKKDKVDEAVIRGKPTSPAVVATPPVVKQHGSRFQTKRSKYRLRWSRDHQPLNGSSAPNKVQRNSSGVMKCYNCGTPGHLTRECPKRKTPK